MAFDRTIVSSPNRASAPTPAPTGRRRRGALVLLGIALVCLVLLVALPTLVGSSSETAGKGADRSLQLEDDGGVLERAVVPGSEESDGADTGDVADQSGSSSEEPQIGEPEVGEPEGPAEPEPPVEPLPATLKAFPDPVQLSPGDYSGSFTIANVGDEAMTWTALSKPTVTLSDTGGELGGKSSTIVSFTVDKSTLSSGSFSFKIKVTGNGGTTYVDVHGFKPFDKVIPKA